MNTKDWILLFVPIICNGLILAFFGKYLDYTINKIQGKNEIQAEFKREFRQKLTETKKKYYIITSLFDSKKFKECADATKRFEESCRDLKYYCNSVSPMLSEQLNMINQIYTHYNKYNRIIKSLMSGGLEQYFYSQINAKKCLIKIGDILEKLMKSSV